MTNNKEEQVWHREVITPEVEQTLQDLEQRSDLEDFYLAGGTGLALRLGHRRSVDIDFFSEKPFDEEQVIQKLSTIEKLSIGSKAPQTIHATIGGVKVSFLGYQYPVLFPFLSFAGVRLADPRDVACMKINAIASRGTRRDFVDLYWVAKDLGLAPLLEFFEKKYASSNYSTIHILKALPYFRDAEKDPMPHMLMDCSWDEVKRFFLKETASSARWRP